MRRHWPVLWRLIVYGGALSGCAHIAAITPDQPTGPLVRLVFLSPDLKAQLATDWTLEPGQHERGYCITRWDTLRTTTRDGLPGPEYQLYALEAERALIELNATGWSVMFVCAPGTLPLHTHPPHSCDRRTGACLAGGWDADQCQPSRGDYLHLRAHGALAGLVQCGPTQFRAFWPDDYR